MGRERCVVCGASASTTGSESSSSSSSSSSIVSEDAASPPRICILGGGFGGLYTALRLSTLVWRGGKKPIITLVDRRDTFVFKPLLYEVVTEELGVDEVAPSYDDLLRGTDVAFTRGRVRSVGPRADDGGPGIVETEEGVTIPYDYVVVAFGSETRLDLADGARKHATPFCDLEDALRVKAFLKSIPETPSGAVPTLAIVGAGTSGVELAASIADRYADRVRVQLITPGRDILSSASEGQRSNAWAILSKGNVDVLLATSVTRVAKDADALKYTLGVEHKERGSECLSADFVVWTAGQKPASVPVPASLSDPFLTRTEAGNLATDTFLRIQGSEYAFALGDIALSGGGGKDQQAMPFTAQVAFQQSDYVAWNLWSAISGQPLLPFQYQHLGDMMSLGKFDATVALPVGGLTLGGAPASLLRKAAYVYRMPTLEQSLRLGINWTQKIVSTISADVLRGGA